MNLRMPAEWEPHSAVWLAWPYDTVTFGSLNQKDNKLDPARLGKVEKEFAKIISVLEKSERVNLIVKDRKQHNYEGRNVSVFEADYADVWTRDYLPTMVKDAQNKTVAVKWIYNAYGDKFPTLLKDNQVWWKVNDSDIPTIETQTILESGAIECNGQGFLLTTEQCLLSRDLSLTKQDWEKILAKHLGTTKVIWLEKGLVNDHTDGHIDEIARFVAPDKVVCAYEENSDDENYAILKKNFEDLSKESFEVIKLPMPHKYFDDGKKAPVSYCNFYIGNKVVLAATFNDPNDEKALKIIQDCFPDREVVGIDCLEIIYGGGAIHCMTQQQPSI